MAGNAVALPRSPQKVENPSHFPTVTRVLAHIIDLERVVRDWIGATGVIMRTWWCGHCSTEPCERAEKLQGSNYRGHRVA